MKFTETPLAGAFLIELEPHADERGFFARSFCSREFHEHGLQDNFVQANIAFNRAKGTLRGMHYQAPPVGETKVVRCTRGALYDVIIDLRPASPTYLQHFGVELTADNHRALYIPIMFAHGLLTLADHTDVHYLMGEFFAPACARSVRYNDPVFGIRWPDEVRVISAKDASIPDFVPAQP